MFDVTQLFDTPPYSLPHAEKTALFERALSALQAHHEEHCPAYRRMVRLLAPRVEGDGIASFPFIPVRLFKEFELRSVAKENVFKTLTSSGTSGQTVSRIFLNREAAANQTKVLVKIISSFTGGKRIPFLIVDSPAIIKDRNLFSARGAGILGFSTIGVNPTYLLDEEFGIDFERLEQFTEKHRGSPVMLFGFTFIVWQHLCMALRQAGRSLDLNGMLVHGGGWKKLTSMAVDNDTFKRTVRETTGIERVYNYYGLVEQTGSIFMECEHGHLHASIYSDVIIRDPLTFHPLPPGREGIVQLVSLLPESYPGHSILTEDVGEIVGIDDCPCGRKGTYFHIHGRLQNAEIRGCSDVAASAA